MGELTAEIRWWGRGETPVPLLRWFEEGDVPPGGGDERTDRYVATDKTQIGIKYRGDSDSLEIKSRIDERPVAALEAGTTVGLWIKQGLELPVEIPTIAIAKWRMLRLFDCTGDAPAEIALDRNEAPVVNGAPPQGCEVELARVVRGEAVWWSLCFEAYGTLDRVAGNLARTLAKLAPLPDALAGAKQASYPQWLAG